MTLVFYSSVPEDNPEEWSTELRRRLPNLDMRVWPDAGPLDDIDIALVFQPPLVCSPHFRIWALSFHLGQESITCFDWKIFPTLHWPE